MVDEVTFEGHDVVIADTLTLLRALPIEPSRVRSRRLFKAPDVTVLGVAIDVGAVMREHVAAVPILIHVIDGRIALELRGKRIDLPAGAMIHVDGRVRHSVEGLEPSRFLLMPLGT